MAKKTQLQKEYERETKRIANAIKRLSKRGYRFEFNPIIERPKRLSKKFVEKLKEFKTKHLYEITTYYDPILGTRVSGTEEQKLIRSRASKKAAQTRYNKKNTTTKTRANEPPSQVDDVLVEVYQLIAQWKPDPRWTPEFAIIKERDKNSLKRMLDGAIQNLGREQVAKNCESRASDVKDLAWFICYGFSGDKKDTGYLADLAALTAIVYGRNWNSNIAKAVQEEAEAFDYENEEE